MNKWRYSKIVAKNKCVCFNDVTYMINDIENEAEHEKCITKIPHKLT